MLTSAVLPAAAPTSPSTLRLLVAGDLVPHRPNLVAEGQLAQALAPLTPLFAQADVVVANYEASTGTLAPRQKSVLVGQGWMKDLATAKVGAVTVANDHACDLGERGLDQTLAKAKEAHITAVGADEHDPWRARVLAEKDGHKVCAVAWTTFVNGHIPTCASSGKIAVATAGPGVAERLARAMSRARAEGCEAVVAVVHGGEEFVPMGGAAWHQADRAAEAGADAVVLHHPHVPSRIEVAHTKDGRAVPIFLSVGNLVSGQGEAWRAGMPPAPADRRKEEKNAWTRLGVVADLAWTWAGPGPPLVGGNAAARSAREPTPTGARPSDDRPGKPTLAWGYHLVWTEQPEIAVRLVDPARDRALILALSADPDGPTQLFGSPCWMEQGKKECYGTGRE
jgi:poly-gamma-glutamate synthesis protein (capsule biosynthesis protein)